MSSNKPLQYESLKVVLQYMDANQRCLLPLRIPSIGSIEKRIPLRYDSISFNTLQTKVNNTTYRLGVYREYPKGCKVPKIHQEANERGGSNVDLTKHGFEIWYGRSPVLLGDVEIHLPNDHFPRGPHREQVMDTDQALYERNLESLEKALKLRLKRGDKASLGMGDPALSYSTQKLRDEIQKVRARLAPYYCRRDGTPLPYTPMIQLTVESPSGTEVYRHRYTMKLQEAMKKVNTTLFTIRDGVHQVNSLRVNEESMVIRLPIGFRIRIRELHIVWKSPSNFTSLREIVVDSSYPLNVLTIADHYLDLATHDHEVVRSAKELNIISKSANESCLPVLRSLNNQSVNWRPPCSKFPPREQALLIKHWIDNDKKVGTKLSYQYIGTMNVNYFLNELMLRFAGNWFNRCVWLPMNNGNTLEVQFNPMAHWSNVTAYSMWEVKMRVIAGLQVNRRY